MTTLADLTDVDLSSAVDGYILTKVPTSGGITYKLMPAPLVGLLGNTDAVTTRLGSQVMEIDPFTGIVDLSDEFETLTFTIKLPDTAPGGWSKVRILLPNPADADQSFNIQFLSDSGTVAIFSHPYEYVFSYVREDAAYTDGDNLTLPGTLTTTGATDVIVSFLPIRTTLDAATWLQVQSGLGGSGNGGSGYIFSGTPETFDAIDYQSYDMSDDSKGWWFVGIDLGGGITPGTNVLLKFSTPTFASGPSMKQVALTGLNDSCNFFTTQDNGTTITPLDVGNLASFTWVQGVVSLLMRLVCLPGYIFGSPTDLWQTSGVPSNPSRGMGGTVTPQVVTPDVPGTDPDTIISSNDLLHGSWSIYLADISGAVVVKLSVPLALGMAPARFRLSNASTVTKLILSDATGHLADTVVDGTDLAALISGDVMDATVYGLYDDGGKYLALPS